MVTPTMVNYDTIRESKFSMAEKRLKGYSTLQRSITSIGEWPWPRPPSKLKMDPSLNALRLTYSYGYSTIKVSTYMDYGV
ncbi:unnamed protein product [Dovyalis caffra]|uniref:Uncharacterized protein n=1 Tax=Dovyalis caffra TaxID=77055 RepID=A0AAV1S0P5_9ROSI|nr:unnamed protein product [Dovyalis caffra]